ncbi:MAG: IS630 family transposase [Anaerolineaceae bacterium]|nr:IS630 family transposase [Anaerolineaceae bacterium]
MAPYKYPIHLCGKDRQVLRALKRAGKTERRVADRARIILWTAERVAVDEIACRLEIHRSTVINWRRWYLERRAAGLSVEESLQDQPRSGRPSKFTPLEITQIKAVACQQPAKLELPLSRFSLTDILDWVLQARIVPQISVSTLWRLLHQDAIRPCYYRAWLFPRDPRFVEKAGPVLDLYRGLWEGKSLGPRDYVISADEKSGLQVLARSHPTLPPISGQPGRYEFEYERRGTLAYLAALDVFSGQVFGHVDDTVGIVPFGKLVDLVMGQTPYSIADRVFWSVDGGSSHHPNTSLARLQAAYANITVVHLPTHASWLNQIEIYFSILTRKALTPMDLPHKQAVKERILGFQERYNEKAKPFRWNFTRDDLLARLEAAN